MDGMITVDKYTVVFWNEKQGWFSRVVDYEPAAIDCKGYGDFVGYNKVSCIVPEDSVVFDELNKEEGV